ncbi:MAG TPA: HdeD family acid-resistance protein [Candidatus Limnocylindria bacterium]
MGINVVAVLGIARMWWAFLVRGILGIVFGVVLILFPTIGLVAVVALFAAWAIIGGVTALIGAWQSRGAHRDWWVTLLEGVAGIVAGLVAILLPGVAALGLLFVIAFWAIVTGVLQIWFAIRMRDQIHGELWLALSGVIAVLFGILLVIFPGGGILSVLLLAGLFSIVFGVAMAVLGFRLRRLHATAVRQHEYAERSLPD